MTNPLKKLYPALPFIFLGCALASLLVFTTAVYDEYQLPKSFTTFIFIFLCLIALLFSKNITAVKPGFSIFAFASYFLMTAASVMFSPCHPQFYYMLTFLSPVFFLAAALIKTDIKKILVLINIAVFASCVFGIWQFIFLRDSGIRRPDSFFGNPIFFADFLAICLPAVFITFLISGKNNIVYLINAMLALCCLLLAASRGALASFAFSFVLLSFLILRTGLFTLKRSAPYVITAVIIAVSLLLIPDFMKIVSYNSERFSDTLSASSSTLRSRMLAADTAVSIGMKNPVFGTGAGGYRYFQQEAQAPLLLSKPYYSFINTPYAHNDYLQIFSEYGGFGLALFLAVVFSVFYKFVVSSRKICDYEYLLGSAFICCAAACLVESFFNFPLSVMPSAALFWFFMGCVYRMSLEPEDAPLKMPKQSAALSKAILAFVLVILAAIAVLKPSGLISNFYLKYALNRDSKNRPDMDYYYSKAIRLAPDSYNVLYYYAISRVKVLDYPEAMKYFNKSLAIYPYSCDAFFNMGNAAYKAGDLKTAEDALLKAEDLYPDFSAVHLILSKIYEGTGRSALAKEEFLKVRRENPGRMEELTGSEIIYLREITATGR